MMLLACFSVLTYKIINVGSANHEAALREEEAAAAAAIANGEPVPEGLRRRKRRNAIANGDESSTVDDEHNRTMDDEDIPLLPEDIMKELRFIFWSTKETKLLTLMWLTCTLQLFVSGALLLMKLLALKHFILENTCHCVLGTGNMLFVVLVIYYVCTHKFGLDNQQQQQLQLQLQQPR